MVTHEVRRKRPEVVEVLLREDDGTPIDRFDMLHGTDGTWTAWTCDTFSESKTASRRVFALQYLSTHYIGGDER